MEPIDAQFNYDSDYLFKTLLFFSPVFIITINRNCVRRASDITRDMLACR